MFEAKVSLLNELSLNVPVTIDILDNWLIVVSILYLCLNEESDAYFATGTLESLESKMNVG